MSDGITWNDITKQTDFRDTDEVVGKRGSAAGAESRWDGATIATWGAGKFAPLSHVSDTSNPHHTTATQVGLGNCDNTSDANKPISSATQSALDGKVPVTRAVNGHALSSDVTVSKSDVGLGNVTNDAQTKAAIVPNTVPTAGQILIGTGTAYAPASVSSDATLAGNGALTLSTVNGNVGSFGNAASSLTATVDSKGRVTAMSSQAISITHSAVSDFNTAASAAAPVQTVAGRTGNVTLAQADVSGLTTSSTPAFADVLFGVSGPSAKSSIASRAPLPGLVFDGTAGATAGVSGVTGDYTIEVCGVLAASDYSSAYAILGSNNPDKMYVDSTSGRIVPFGSAYEIGSAVPLGKAFHTVLSRASGTLSAYRDGVLEATHADTFNIATITKVGCGNAGEIPWLGTLRVHIWNRSSTAAEVLSLFQDATPAASDYCNAGTQLITGDNSTMANDTGFWTKSGAASIGSGVCSFGPGAGNIKRSGLLNPICKYLLGITVNSGSVRVEDEVNYISPQLSAGVHLIEIKASTGTAFRIDLYGSTTAEFTNVTLTPIGLVGAWDLSHLQLTSTSAPAMPGVSCGPLTWSTGVKPSVPWSGTLPGPVTVGGDLHATGTGVSTVAGSLNVQGSLGSHQSATLSLGYEGNGVSQAVAYGSDGALGRFKIVLRKAGTGADAITSADFSAAGVAFGGGSAVKGIFSNVATIDVPSLAPGDSTQIDIAVSSAAVGDHAEICIAYAGGPYSGLVYSPAWVSAAGTVSVIVQNIRATTLDPAAQIYRATVFKF